MWEGEKYILRLGHILGEELFKNIIRRMPSAFQHVSMQAEQIASYLHYDLCETVRYAEYMPSLLLAVVGSKDSTILKCLGLLFLFLTAIID